MPEEDIMEQSTAPQPEQAPEPQSASQPEEAQLEEFSAEEEEREKEEERKKRGLVALLTTLIVLCLIVEVVLASYITLNLYRNAENQRIMTIQYEAYLEQQAQARENPPKVQYIGPTVRVVDGVLVDSQAAAQAVRAQTEGTIPGL